MELILMAIEGKILLMSTRVASFYYRICYELHLTNHHAIKLGKMLSNTRENR